MGEAKLCPTCKRLPSYRVGFDWKPGSLTDPCQDPIHDAADGVAAMQAALERLSTIQLWDDGDHAAEGAQDEVRDIAKYALARAREGEKR